MGAWSAYAMMGCRATYERLARNDSAKSYPSTFSLDPPIDRLGDGRELPNVLLAVAQPRTELLAKAHQLPGLRQIESLERFQQGPFKVGPKGAPPFVSGLPADWS